MREGFTLGFYFTAYKQDSCYVDPFCLLVRAAPSGCIYCTVIYSARSSSQINMHLNMCLYR